jgi:hypothetical protein
LASYDDSSVPPPLGVLIYVVLLQSFFWRAIQEIDPNLLLWSFRASSGPQRKRQTSLTIKRRIKRH